MELIQLKACQFLMPGFIDTHIHAPQFAQNGLGLDMELLDWLNNYTFPLESKFADKDFASKIYNIVVVCASLNYYVLFLVALLFGKRFDDKRVNFAYYQLWKPDSFTVNIVYGLVFTENHLIYGNYNGLLLWNQPPRKHLGFSGNRSDSRTKSSHWKSVFL